MVRLAPADQVVFKNGDRLTGKVERLERGRLVIVTKVAGTVNVNMADVQTLSIDEPLGVHLKDGTRITRPLTTAPAGRFAVVPATQPATTTAGGTSTAKSYPVDDIIRINPLTARWSGNVKAGALVTRGNTDTDNLSVNADAIRQSDGDRLTLAGGYFFGQQKAKDSDKKLTSVDSAFALGKYDYYFGPKWYGYANARLDKDQIANLNLRATPGAGVGYRWIESNVTNFSTELGGAWVYEQFSDPQETKQFYAARLAYHIDHKINDRVSFFHDMEFLPDIVDPSIYLVNTEVGLRTSLTGSIFTEMKIVYNLNTDPAPTAAQNDLRYILSLGWSF